MNDDLEINAYVHYGEYDYNFKYPTLVLQGEFGSAGYNVDPETGDLKRTCICYARSDNECICM